MSRGNDPFQESLSATAEAVNATLESLLSIPEGKERRLFDAMRYAALDGGKRLRPFLVVQTAGLFGVDGSQAFRAAAAVEMVHCYSLVHDDLPAMDDDDLRRGRPTVHRAFDDATAVLAGDGLLTEAFAVLAGSKTHPKAEVRAELCLALATAAGANGMVGGQMIDLLAQTDSLSEEETERLQALKTGRLLGAAAEFGAILGEADEGSRQALKDYGLALGAAFQIADDLLDLESSAEETGKHTGKDVAAGKATFISLYGPERARTRAKSFADQAVEALHRFGPEAQTLREAAKFAVERRT